MGCADQVRGTIPEEVLETSPGRQTDEASGASNGRAIPLERLRAASGSIENEGPE